MDAHSLPLRDEGHKFVNGFHRFLIGGPRKRRTERKKENYNKSSDWSEKKDKYKQKEREGKEKKRTKEKERSIWERLGREKEKYDLELRKK